MGEKITVKYIYPAAVQAMLNHYGDECDKIFERAKQQLKEKNLTARQMQVIQNTVQRDIKPFMDEMVRLREVVLPKIEVRL